jgi:undecaprenyl diphosphate synthase
MDGNGRWAREKGKKRIFGHQAGAKALKNVIREVFSLKIPYLSLYVFSVDNWKRDPEEVDFLMKLIQNFHKREYPEIKKQKIKILHSGIYYPLPEENIKILKTIEEETRDFTNGTLNLCLNYGGRTEIVEGIKKLFQDADNGNLDYPIEELTPERFSRYLFYPEVPDVDLMIRTSGEFRISDFHLWRIAYSELYFTDVLWPDFSKEELHEALYQYQNRERRFGGVLK